MTNNEIRQLARECGFAGWLGLLWGNEVALLRFARRIEARVTDRQRNNIKTGAVHTQTPSVR